MSHGERKMGVSVVKAHGGDMGGGNGDVVNGRSIDCVGRSG